MKKPKAILNDKFKPLFTEPSRYAIVTGGRGSAKSFSVSVYLLLLAYYQKDEKILFTRKTLTSAHISIIPEFQEKIELLGLEKYFQVKRTEITSLRTGSQIIFRGLQSSSKDNTANLKSLQGVTCWVLDEAEELTDEPTFDRINLSIRKKGKEIKTILIMNPATKEHFIYQRFFESMSINAGWNGTKENTTYIHTTYLDNVNNLNDDFIRDAELMKERRPEKYKHIIMGGWLEKAEGVIFTNWRIGKYEMHSEPILGQDFGFSIDPTTLIECSFNKGKKEIYVKEHLYKAGLITSEIFNINKRYAGNRLIIADSAEPRLIEELERLGNNIEGAEKIGITDGIAMLKDWEIIVDPDSKNLIKELNNYAWSDRKKSTPVDAWNHLLDPLRYVIVKYLNPTPETFFF